jgi:hypothetical protein
VGSRLVLAIAVLLLVHGRSWAQVSDAARDDVLVIPGAPDDYWKAASLAGAAPTGPRFLLEFIRAIEAMEIHDTARLRSVYDYLSPDRQARAQGGRSFTVPLPLRASVWSKHVSSSGPSDLFAAAMKDRRARRLLYGAAALNPMTRQYLEGRSALVERLHRNHSDVFALLGRSISVRDGRVDVPGGPAAVELWELVVGAPVSTPDVFVDRLLAADTGELAALYDAVAHLDVAHQRFMLGLWMPDAAKRRLRFTALYRAARAAGRRVAIAHQPFVRTGLDLFTVVSQFRVLDDGRPAPPASPAFWRSMVQQLDRWPDTEWSGAPDETTVDATWFVEVVLLSTKSIWEQTAAITFAQRLYAAPEASGSSSEPLAYVVRQFSRSPALALTLERAGVRDVSVYVAAFNRAGGLSARGTNPYWHRQVLTQFQAALSLVQQLRATDRIAVPVAERLITSLARIEPAAAGVYGGAIARWVAEQLLPAIGADAATSAETESLLLAALAGAPRDEGSQRRLTWEDWEYRIDSSLVPLRRLTQIRRLQAGNSLDAVLRVWRAAALVPASRAEELSRGGSDPDALDRVRRASAAVRALIETIREPNQPTDGSRRDGPDVRTTLRESVAALDGIREARQLSRVPEIAQRLMKAVDVLTADVLASLLYAIHIRDPQSPLWLQGDVAYRHDFGLQNRDNLDPDVLSWWFPSEQLGSTWHVRGSLLGLDLALARLRLPQVAAGGPPALPVMAPEDQRVFLESVALFDPGPAADEAMQSIGDSIRSGRERVRAAARNAQAVDRLAELGHVGEWRRHYVFPWLVANAADEVVQAFSLTELYRIGQSARVDAPGGADSWGVTAFSVAGCQCLQIAAPQAWEDVSGRIGVVPAVMPDATLRLAELLSELKLPAVLARHLLPVLMRTFLDRVQMVYSDDWTAVARYWTTVSRDRIEDAMGQLTVDGPLLAGEAPPRR